MLSPQKLLARSHGSLDPRPVIADGLGLEPALCQIPQGPGPFPPSFSSGRSQHFSAGLDPPEAAGGNLCLTLLQGYLGRHLALPAPAPASPPA